MAIDIHNHLHFPFGTPYTLEPERLVGSGVLERAVLLSVGNAWTSYTQDEDEEILRLAKAYDGFFVPFAHLDLTRPPESVDDFHRRGFAGLKAIFPPFPYDDERCFPFYERAEKYLMPILFHLGGSGYFPPEQVTLPASRFASKNMMVITIDLVAKLFPKLPIIGGHFGGGRDSYQMAVYIAKGHPNVVLETSCSPVEREEPELIKNALDVLGPDKVLFGSDSRLDTPVAKVAFWEARLNEIQAGPVAKEKFLRGNAAKLIADSGFDPSRIVLQDQ
ncbi:MAG: amidohydrolase family protein [Candidatus Latescibacteria bacterium]|nr:amidohydrolase family protein [Candidatus Latescibacterota bacterium]